MPIVASWVSPPIILPLATFNPTLFSWASEILSKIIPSEPSSRGRPYPPIHPQSPLSVHTVLALSSATAISPHVEHGQLSRHATLVCFGASKLGESDPGRCRSWAVMPIQGDLRVLSIIYLCATGIHMYLPWKGVPWAGTCKAQRTWLFRSPLGYHGYLPSFDFADLWRKDLQCPIPVGASLGSVYRSTIMLRITWALTSHSFLKIFSSPLWPSLATQQPHQFADSADHPRGSVPRVNLHQIISFSVRHSAFAWGLFRAGLGSMPACPPRTLCTSCGRAYGTAVSHSRPSTHHVPADTP